jgi:hypothetical protein
MPQAKLRRIDDHQFRNLFLLPLLIIVSPRRGDLGQHCRSLGSNMMADDAIHVVPDDRFDDWIVRAADGELGHYPTRERAELAAQAIAAARKAELVIHLPDGRTSRKSFADSWLDRILTR